MTTDAPPEKMMVDVAAWSDAKFIANLLADADAMSSNGSHAWAAMCREAARRLSAPAPAAPRVGDDATGLEQWTDAEAIAGLRGDAADIHGRRLHMLANRMRDAAARIERLSAPPAASAERDDDIALIQLIFANSKVTRATGERIVRAIFAAGYRKRAAQGVGARSWNDDALHKGLLLEVRNARRAEDGKRLDDFLDQTTLNNIVLQITEGGSAIEEHVALRLSALPKGQEHEG